MSIFEKIASLIIVLLIIWSGWLMLSLERINNANEKLTALNSTQHIILSTVLQISVTFNEISRNNLRERDTAAVASETVKTIIKTVIVGDKCAAIDAPSDATIELHNHANRIRSNAISTHSSTLTQ
ncbi:hypothetical protein [Providencia heimbachae]|uniref:Phage protein n=1 Tax=Providencia heimbachae ATCC 35613 TaxID=1354272 RepID=A0A1B7K1I3_9GAMM|nr:hypothetical protein [Providencia heimbachae]OAT53996.1 phage protein [Providencia heimbachae ATCC 35613]SQH13734.1 Uncharacterised protein [Providencia heimbachae]